MSSHDPSHPAKPPVRVQIADPHLARLLGHSELEARTDGDPDPPPIHANLTERQAKALFDGIEDRYPPILTYAQAAEIAQVSISTLKGWFSQGKFAKCVKRSKPGRVLRDAFVRELMKDEFG